MKTIKRAIHSVLNQTYSNFEVIVIDDASQDETGNLVASFDDDKIKYIRHETNKGGAAARNTGIRESQGQYIAFLDSDDEWLPNKLKLQVELFKRSSADVGAIYTGLTVISQDNNEIINHRIPSVSGDLEPALYAENLIGPLSSLMVRRSCLGNSGFFDERLPSCQDWDLCIRLASVTHFLFIEDPLVNYYLNKDSITANPRAKAIGHEFILNKYIGQIKSDRFVYAKQTLTIGHYFNLSGDRKTAVFYFLKALFSYPLYLRIYPYLLGALLTGPFYSRLTAFIRALRF
ncbi:MAG: glycosyltransferase [Proteobacteria bacterium]|nr:glycosyltransferase [Pseudomonadota bacterium]